MTVLILKIVVASDVGADAGDAVGPSVGENVGADVGDAVGDATAAMRDASCASAVGCCLGTSIRLMH